MAASRADIRGWFDEGVNQGAARMFVVCDTFDWDDYPIFIQPGKDAHEAAREHNLPENGTENSNMQKLMEVYDLTKDPELQFASGMRVFNW